MAIISNQTSAPPYAEIYSEVKNSIEESQHLECKWFAASSLRTKVFQSVITDMNLAKPEFIPKLTEAIWKACLYTAPVVLTQIAPNECFAHKEDALMELSFAEIGIDIKTIQDSRIRVGIESLAKFLNFKFGENEGVAISCNIYQGLHVFVIEKRSNDCCVIYQSYLSIIPTNSYSFEEFLKDDSKHVMWKPEKLVKSLSKVLAKDLPIEKRNKNYEKLFFDKLIPGFLTIKDSVCNFPFMFVETNPYFLRKT